MERWLDGRITWSSVAGYYEHLDRDLALGPNVASFLGHSNLRIAAMGLPRALDEPRATEDELATMERHLGEALDAGYLGLSLSMLPWHRMDGDPFVGISIPSQQAAPREYTRLARTLRRRGRILQATPNAVARTTVLQLLALSAGFRLRRPLKTTIVAALDAKTYPFIYRLATGLATVANRVLGGDLRFQALATPFLLYGDGITNPAFEELEAGMEAIGLDPETRKARFRDPAFRERFRGQWTAPGIKVFHWNLDDIWILGVPGHEEWTGRSFADVARELELDPVDLFMDLVAEHDEALRWKTVAANERDGPRRFMLGHPFTLPGFSDAGAHTRNMGFQDGHLHVLRDSLRHPGWMSPQRAVARLTRETADWLGLDAGRLDEGARADLAVLDPERLRRDLPDEPVEQRPDFLYGAMRMVRESAGIVRHVLVGGRPVFDEEEGFHPDLGRRRFGRLLRASA